MKTTEFKVGDVVEDSWYADAGTGVIKEILKTRMKIYFERATFGLNYHCPLFRNVSDDGLLTYDKSHYQFLRKYENQKII
jgi:hypothetical protein